MRVIAADGSQAGIMTRFEALSLAQSSELDLVEVSPMAEPPVVRIMDFGKYIFEQKKKTHSAQKKQKQQQIKEVKFRPGTEEADYQVKMRNLVRFLAEGDKAKVTLRFRGREMAHQEIGRRLLERVSTDLNLIATIEQFPLMEGRQMVTVFAPNKTSRVHTGRAPRGVGAARVDLAPARKRIRKGSANGARKRRE